MARSASLARVLVFTIVASAVTYAQQLKPDQLLVFISATDGSGAPLPDLKPEEIAFTENGVAGKVVSLEAYQLPVKLTIAVDNGMDSTTALTSLREGLKGLVDALPPTVEVTLITLTQPQTVVRPTTDRAQITQGVTTFGPEPRGIPKFSEMLVSYAERIEKDFKDKKLTYQPLLIVLSTPTPEVENIQPDTIQKALNTLQMRGARVSMIMFTSTPTNTVSVANMKQGRQAVIAAPIVKASRGKSEIVTAFNQLTMLLPAWGKEIAVSHTKQANQYRTIIQRPGGNSGPLTNLGLKLTRPGADGAVSPDGRFP